MRIDYIAHPEHATRYQVFDNETGEDIRDIAWADDEAGRYAVFLTRKRTMSDGKDVDLRRRHQDGSFVLEENEGHITIVDTAENPLKGPFLALLNDPEVVAAIGAALSQQESHVVRLVKSLADSAEKFRDCELPRFRRAPSEDEQERVNRLADNVLYDHHREKNEKEEFDFSDWADGTDNR